MADQGKSRRLRAIFKNAIVWGVAWGGLGTVVASLMRLNDNIPLLNAILDGIGMGIRIGIVGALTGAAFSTFISVAYRGKRLAEISAVRFGIGGAILAGVFVPTWMQTMNLLSGSGMVPWNLVTDDIIFSTVFGGITAAGTMFLAKRDEARNPVTVQELLDRMEHESLGSGKAPGYETTQRSRSMQETRQGSPRP
jgi:hypothetical protein